MADTYPQIDVTTLQRVEQLLTSADLGTADEHANRAPVPATMSAGGSPADHAGGPGDGFTPLPRRR